MRRDGSDVDLALCSSAMNVCGTLSSALLKQSLMSLVESSTKAWLERLSKGQAVNLLLDCCLSRCEFGQCFDMSSASHCNLLQTSSLTRLRWRHRLGAGFKALSTTSTIIAEAERLRTVVLQAEFSGRVTSPMPSQVLSRLGLSAGFFGGSIFAQAWLGSLWVCPHSLQGSGGGVGMTREWPVRLCHLRTLDYLKTSWRLASLVVEVVEAYDLGVPSYRVLYLFFCEPTNTLSSDTNGLFMWSQHSFLSGWTFANGHIYVYVRVYKYTFNYNCTISMFSTLWATGCGLAPRSVLPFSVSGWTLLEQFSTATPLDETVLLGLMDFQQDFQQLPGG